MDKAYRMDVFSMLKTSFKNKNARNIERLPIKEAKQIIKSSIACLKKEINYLGESCLDQLADLIHGCTGPYGELQNLFEVLEDTQKIGDLLVELGFKDIVLKIYGKINCPGTKLNETIKAIWQITNYLCYYFGVNNQKLNMCLGDAGAVEQITLGIQLLGFTGIRHNKENIVICVGSLGILYNIAKFTNNNDQFKQARTAQIIMKLEDDGDLESSEDMRIFLIPYLVDENEYDRIADNKDFIGWLIQLLRNSIETGNPKVLDIVDKMTILIIKPWEIIRCLSKLALHDLNKAKIIDKGVLVEFAKVFSRKDVKEVRNVTECLWTLAFNKNVRQTIKDAPEIFSTLEKLKDSDDGDIRKNANGAIWMINGENEAEINHSLQVNHDRHIFISYNWADKETVKSIYERLKDNGYTIWIDWDKVKGSTLQAMAEAVENASVVLICMSEKYKQSSNCRTEASYTYKKKKEYIPLIMQKNYDPDGWLGLLLGTQLFFDFSGKYPFENKIQELLKELSNVLEINHFQDQRQKSLADAQHKSHQSMFCVLS